MLREKLYEILESKEQEIIKIRRFLHQHPEPSFEEFGTAAYIRNFYEGKVIEWIRYPVGKNGIAVKIKGGASGKTIAIRADFDALPVKEETGAVYHSLNEGFSHACGHDAHTAVLLMVADALIEVRDELPGDVIIIHQYAEETPPGGAKSMIEDGVLNNVDAVIGGHVWAAYDAGTIAVRSGMTMAGRAYFKVIITGKGGHGSQPQQCVDPIVAASNFVVSVQSVVSRNVSPLDSAVITVGRFDGAGIFNVIPDSVTLEGDVRSCSDTVSSLTEKRFREILSGITAAYGCTYELVYEHDYPPVINDEILAVSARTFIREDSVSGLKLRDGELIMGSEDFSYYQQQIPGLYVFFGAKPKGEFYPHHHSKFDIDEGCLINCAKFFAGFALKYLKG